MIFSKKLLEKLDKYLNLLLVFILPSQLALHFWPSSAFIFGIRVDYLSPTLYFTDVLFLSAVILSFACHKISSGKIKTKYYFVAFIILLLMSVNIVFSASPFISIIKWLKICEASLFVLYVKNRRDIFTTKNVVNTLIISLLLFSSIAIAQIFTGKTIGGLFYWLGERTFSIFTPGIALVNVFGKNYLRAYSTFSHPNALAGYFGISLIYILFNIRNYDKRKITIYLLPIIFIPYILSFSLSSFIAAIVCLLMYLFKTKILNKNFLFSFLLALTIFSLALCISSGTINSHLPNLGNSFSERLVLAGNAGRVFSKHPIIGSGLNTFIIVNNWASDPNKIWLFQPVHNIFLLVLSEIGVAGLITMYLLINIIIKQINIHKVMWPVMILVFILVTGLFDHYWITSQQNLLLISLFLGLSL